MRDGNRPFSLVLTYADQAAIAFNEGAGAGNTFLSTLSKPGTLPLIILSTVATIIASQSIITDAFSMTRHAIQLGWFPRMRIS